MATCLALSVGSFLAMSTASARVIQVGPNETVKTIAEAARLAKDDDVVEIASGNYEGDVTVWKQKKLTIRGIGERPVLLAAGRIAEGKAIWVIRNGDFNVSNLEFRGARAKDGNGAGIRFENGKLNILRCAFFDNQTGILTGNSSGAALTIEESIFGQAPKQETPLPHLLYAGRIDLLRVTGSRFHGGHYGHLLKSRARISDIRYNLLVDGTGGKASYEADFPAGGDVTLVGNVLAQSSSTENITMVAYGAEGGQWQQNRLRMVHNTFYSEGRRPAWFLRVFGSRLSSAPIVMTRNNLLVGYGLFTSFVDGDHEGNEFARESVLGNPLIFDFTVSADSSLRRIVPNMKLELEKLQPLFQHVAPGRVSVIPSASKWAPGAVQATQSNIK